VAVDNGGNVFVADSTSHTIRKVTSGGEVTTLAGSAGVSGTNDGTGSAARFYHPQGVAVDSAGNVFVADTYNSTIRKVTAAGVVTTLAGCAVAPGTADGTGSAAMFSYPWGVAVDSAGNVFVADTYNHTIGQVTPAGVVTTIGGVGGVMGGADGIGSFANFAYPSGIAVDSVDNIYVADTENNRISKGTPIYPRITAESDGTRLHLSWPAVCLGWELQAQTDLTGAGLGTNWLPVAGSTTNTQMSIPIDPTSPGVFYRLHHL
jgi:sugar lactone lactonase YvrE